MQPRESLPMFLGHGWVLHTEFGLVISWGDYRALYCWSECSAIPRKCLRNPSTWSRCKRSTVLFWGLQDFGSAARRLAGHPGRQLTHAKPHGRLCMRQWWNPSWTASGSASLQCSVGSMRVWFMQMWRFLDTLSMRDVFGVEFPKHRFEAILLLSSNTGNTIL